MQKGLSSFRRFDERNCIGKTSLLLHSFSSLFMIFGGFTKIKIKNTFKKTLAESKVKFQIELIKNPCFVLGIKLTVDFFEYINKDVCCVNSLEEMSNSLTNSAPLRFSREKSKSIYDKKLKK